MKDIRHFDRIADALDEEARLLALVAEGDSDFEAMLWTAGQSLVAPDGWHVAPPLADSVKT